MEDILKSYIKEIVAAYNRGDAREESFYIVLEKLIVNTADALRKKNIHITILPKKTEAGNPDFRVWDGKSKIVGYIEAKAPGTDLDDVENSEQLKRYINTFPNLILTDFFEFRFFRDGKPVDAVSIARKHTLLKLGAKPVLENEDEFKELFFKYFSFTFPNNLDARQLAKELARRTRFLKDQVIIEELKKDPGQGRNYISGFYEAFKMYLIHNLTGEDFADLYSQTVTYGLFAARTRCNEDFTRERAIKFIPQSIGFLHDVFEFISMGKPPEQLEWIIDDISEVLASVNVSKILDEFFQDGKGDDPIIHFYETFLSEYNPKLREMRGVYYTPEPVVSFIVRSLDIILKGHFNKPDGLADLSVNVLDPAAGTMTFIAKAAVLAMKQYTGKYGQGVKEGFVRGHLLKNFYAFELMMAPYTVGHLKMSLIFEELGIQIKELERFKLYLTNALEMHDIEQSNLPGMYTLSEESRLAGQIKKKTPILVIMGNPPYSGHSVNTGEWISKEIKDYYKVDGKPLGEKNPKWLQDDYVKFIRFAQWKLDQNGEGVLGFITNHGYLDNPTFRGMRLSLMKSFESIYILDLHGNAKKKEKCPDGSKDENVFDIQQGVAIALFIKKRDNTNTCKVYHSELWGLREDKYESLSKNDIKTVKWKEIAPKPGNYLLTPFDAAFEDNYVKFIKITDIFPVNSVGIVTAKDKLTIQWGPDEVYRTITGFSKLEAEEARVVYGLGPDARDWKVSWAQRDLIDSGLKRENIHPILYRPFDIRYTYYTGNSSGFHCRPREQVMKNMIKKNLGLITRRQMLPNQSCNYIFISDSLISDGVIRSDNKGSESLFPLYIYPGQNGLFNNAKHNLDLNIIEHIRKSLQKNDPSPGDIFYYIYAVLYSNIYREKYSEFLQIDFPRIPFTSDYELFVKLGKLGNRLADIHLMKSEELDRTFSKFEVKGDNQVKKVHYLVNEKKVYINDTQYFSNIDKDTWEYHIGGYQALEKWLKDRKNRTLSLEDIHHYIKIACALRLTIQYQEKIDELYEGIEKSLIKF